MTIAREGEAYATEKRLSIYGRCICSRVIAPVLGGKSRSYMGRRKVFRPLRTKGDICSSQFSNRHFRTKKSCELFGALTGSSWTLIAKGTERWENEHWPGLPVQRNMDRLKIMRFLDTNASVANHRRVRHLAQPVQETFFEHTVRTVGCMCEISLY